MQTQLFENAQWQCKLQNIHQREAHAFIWSKINNLKDERNTHLIFKAKQILFKVLHSSSMDFFELGKLSELICQSKSNNKLTESFLY